MGYDSRSQQKKTTREKWQRRRKDGRPSQTDVIFVVMDAFENVFVGEVLILHYHENGDCQEPDDRHSDRSRGGSALLQLAAVFQSDCLRVSFELQCRHDGRCPGQ